MFKCIVMQISQVNREKGYWPVNEYGINQFVNFSVSPSLIGQYLNKPIIQSISVVVIFYIACQLLVVHQSINQYVPPSVHQSVRQIDSQSVSPCICSSVRQTVSQYISQFTVVYLSISPSIAFMVATHGEIGTDQMESSQIFLVKTIFTDQSKTVIIKT